MANEKIPRTFLTFWKFNKRKWDWHCFSKNHFINSAYVLLFQFYEYHPVWNSFSNDNPFPSSVFLSFWATCPPTTLTSTEIEIFRWISDFYRDWRKDSFFPSGCWDVSPDMTRRDEMWWGWSLCEPGYSREYFMMTTDPGSVIIHGAPPPAPPVVMLL